MKVVRTKIEVSPMELALFRAGWSFIKEDTVILNKVKQFRMLLPDTPEELLMSGTSAISEDLEILKRDLTAVIDQCAVRMSDEQKRDFIYFSLNADLTLLEG